MIALWRGLLFTFIASKYTAAAAAAAESRNAASPGGSEKQELQRRDDGGDDGGGGCGGGGGGGRCDLSNATCLPPRFAINNIIAVIAAAAAVRTRVFRPR